MNIQDFNIKIIGEGQPIFMLHGFYLDQVSLVAACEPVLEGMAFKRIYLDLPGMGMNQHTIGIDSADEMINALVAVAKELIGEEPFYLLGMSYGGYLARGLSQKLRERCLGMFLLVPVVFPKFEDRTLPPHEVVYEEASYTSGLDEALLDSLRQANVIITERVVQRQKVEIDEAVARANEAFLETYQQKGYSARFDVDEGCEKCTFPVSIIVGKQDSVVGYEDQFNLCKRYKRASYMVVDGAGHGLHYEQEAVFNQALRMWLNP